MKKMYKGFLILNLNFSCFLILTLIINIFIFNISSTYAFSIRQSDKTPKSYHNIRMILKNINRNNFEKRLKKFIQVSSPNRMVGREGHAKAQKFILDNIRKLDHNLNLLYVDEFEPNISWAQKTYKKEFNDKIVGKFQPNSIEYRNGSVFTRSIVGMLEKLKGVKGKNLIWEKKGVLKSDKILVIGAHYDTVFLRRDDFRIIPNGEMEGADNNASAVIVLLSLIDVLSKLDLPYTVRVIFFDFEEWQSMGSKAYVDKYLKTNNEKYLGFINLLMLGHDSKISDKSKQLGNMKAYIQGELSSGHSIDKTFAKRLISSGKRLRPGVRFSLMANGFDRTGTVHFWPYKVPTIVFTHDWENDSNEIRTHSDQDFLETINVKTLFDSFHYITGSVISYLFNIER